MTVARTVVNRNDVSPESLHSGNADEPERKLPPGHVPLQSDVTTMTAPDGATMVIRNSSGDAPPHFHLKQTFFYILSGKMIIRDREYPAGTWGLEPYGAIHLKTQFGPCEYLSWSQPGVALLIDDPDNIPQWILDAGGTADDYASLVDTSAAPPIPLGDGLSMKVLHVFAGQGAFVTKIHAHAGTPLPPRRYLGVCDIFVLNGALKFADGPVAAAGSWVHHQAGTEEEATTCTEDTELLVTSYGSIMEFNEHGSVARVVDGCSLRDLAQSRLDGVVVDPMSDRWKQAVNNFFDWSSPRMTTAGRAR
jgi:hypothetical protein